MSALLNVIHPFPERELPVYNKEETKGPDKYKFYDRLFTENHSLEVGIVAGFYYHDYINSAFVRENSVNFNDIVYQTTENQLHFQSKLFSEYRTYVHAPSELFGENITECWKYFRRINHAQ